MSSLWDSFKGAAASVGSAAGSVAASAAVSVGSAAGKAAQRTTKKTELLFIDREILQRKQAFGELVSSGY
jgi:hypothetical protein